MSQHFRDPVEGFPARQGQRSKRVAGLAHRPLAETGPRERGAPHALPQVGAILSIGRHVIIGIPPFADTVIVEK
jgi:hypothetical protein